MASELGYDPSYNFLLVDYRHANPRYWQASLSGAGAAARDTLAAVNRLLENLRQTYPGPTAPGDLQR
jgi:hypothetical protein